MLLPLLSGCANTAQRKRAEALAEWLNAQEFSTWSAFLNREDTPHQPDSPDGLTLGSPNVFAAIGCNEKDLSSLDVFWSDRRTMRPFAKPMTVSIETNGLGGGRRRRLLSSFDSQTLRRVRHTAIAVSQSEQDGLRVTSVDFAPMQSKQNFLARWFLVENVGRSFFPGSLLFNVTAPGEWKKVDANALTRGDQLAFISDHRLAYHADSIEITLGKLGTGQRAAAALLITASHNMSDLADSIKEARAALAKLPDLLEETRKDWEKWCAQTPLATGDERTDDLLDSLLCLARSHLGVDAIHTGSVRYPHNRAWVRDNYWVQRTLLELNHVVEAQVGLNFFHQAWRKSGIASSYEIPSGRAAAYGYHRVELPHYLVLMVRDAEQLGGVDGGKYWDMVKGCLDLAAVPGNSLQPMNGDETWLLAAPVRELDDLLDNSWLLIASAEYGAKLALRMGDRERAVRYGAMAYQARLSLRNFMPSSQQPKWYAIGRGGDGSQDYNLCPEVYARGAVLGVLPATDPLLVSGLQAGWERLQFGRGLRAHAQSAAICGGTPGYILYAAGNNPATAAIGQQLAQRVRKFASATGCVWEFHDMYNPAWGGEKSRLWDSAALLLGMVHALFEVGRYGGKTELTPKRAEAVAAFGNAPLSPFDARMAEELLVKAGPALILHQNAPEHAARIARELLRQRNQKFGVGFYLGAPPDNQSAIIIAPESPPGIWFQTPLGYSVRAWEGPPQIWVMNSGNVFFDTDPVLVDLLSFLVPRRKQPLPFPDANYALAERFGKLPTGMARIAVNSGTSGTVEMLNLAGGTVTLSPGRTEVSVKATSDVTRRTLQLSVTAAAPRLDPVEIAITLPPGWWLLFARDMTGKWDRVEDQVREMRLANGQTQLVYAFRPGTDVINLNFDLAQLEVNTIQTAIEAGTPESGE